MPADAVTSSGSGLDPHISSAYALLQAQRVANARKISKDKVIDLIDKNTDRRAWDSWVIRVNILMLNIALDNGFSSSGKRSNTTSEVRMRPVHCAIRYLHLVYGNRVVNLPHLLSER